MAARTRLVQSTAGPSSQRRQASQLPEHEPVQFTMTVDAQRKIADLASKHELSKVYKDFAAAITTLSNSVAEINERLTERKERLQRQRTRKAAAEAGNDAEDDGGNEENRDPLAIFTKKVENMTERIEAGIRQAIDGQESVAFTRDTLAASANNARDQASTQASLQVQQSQRQAQRARAADGDEDMEDETEYPEVTPTDPEGATQTVTGPTTFFEGKLNDHRLLQSSKSKFEKYADHNEYRNFRGLLHGAQFPDESVPLPAPEDWFEDGSLARPGVTQTGNEDDDDEDLQMTRAKTSTKCPITLQEFREPLSSKKCSHTFEASAIRQMLVNSTTRINQTVTARGFTGGDRAVRCPVQGCEHMLMMTDLYVDEIIKRKIRNLQRAKQLQDQEMQDGDAGPEGQVIEDDEDDALNIDDIEDEAPSTMKMKLEARSSRV